MKTTYLLPILLFVGMMCIACSAIDASTFNGTNVKTPMLAENATVPTAGLTEPSYFYTYEELNNYLNSAKSYETSDKLRSNLNEEQKRKMETAINKWNVGDLQSYYMPTWIPENYMLALISVTERYFAFHYIPHDYDLNVYHTHEETLNNLISFEWTRVENGEKLLENDIALFGLISNDEKGDLYFYDFGDSVNPDTNIARSYFWLQDGYEFMMTVPLNVLTDKSEIQKFTKDSSISSSTISISEEESNAISNSASKVILGE